MRDDPHRTIWVYAIRADGGFFNVAESLEWIADHRPADEARATRAIPTALLQHEWVAIGRIGTENIQQAYTISGEVRGEDFRAHVISVWVNERYVHLDTQGSSQLLNG